MDVWIMEGFGNVLMVMAFMWVVFIDGSICIVR